MYLAFLFLTDDVTNAQTARVESNPNTDLKEHVKMPRTMIENDDNAGLNRGVGGGFSGFIDTTPQFPRRNFQHQTAQ